MEVFIDAGREQAKRLNCEVMLASINSDWITEEMTIMTKNIRKDNNAPGESVMLSGTGR